jgi:hypothetical protein
MNLFPMDALSEADISDIVAKAGGLRAHPDADRRNLPGADFLVDRTLIELKLLDDEGFSKPARQAKLAKLFLAIDPGRPVVVLDPQNLSEADQRKYRSIVEGPLKNAVGKARDQLVQSRSELTDSDGSVLWIVNTGYMALDHDTLQEVVANRVRQDTSKIDGVIVSGCYFHSDGFDGVVLWTMTYVPINIGYNFTAFEKLQDSWNAFAERFMTDVVQGKQEAGKKLAVTDISFDVDGVRFVRPAPPLGQPSDFYVNGRPRANSSGIDDCPPVALIVPQLSITEHATVLAAIGATYGPLSSHERWCNHVKNAGKASQPTKPLVTVPVSAEAWLAWCCETGEHPSVDALRRYAHHRFTEQMTALLENARERKNGSVVLSSYMLAVTEEIGQDRANDVSHIAAVREHPDGDASIQPIVENLRIFHEHAVALAAAYALVEGKPAVLWQKKRKYLWA